VGKQLTVNYNQGEILNANLSVKNPSSNQLSEFKLKIDKSVFVHEQKGKIKAKYRIFETLGRGSFGEVKKV